MTAWAGGRRVARGSPDAVRLGRAVPAHRGGAEAGPAPAVTKRRPGTCTTWPGPVRFRIDAAGRVVERVYDPWDRMTEYRQWDRAAGEIPGLEAGRPTVPFAGAAWLSAYDAVGNLAAAADPAGREDPGLRLAQPGDRGVMDLARRGRGRAPCRRASRRGAPTTTTTTWCGWRRRRGSVRSWRTWVRGRI